MAYLDEVLALNPTIHYPCDDAGVDVLDASGNNHHAVMISISGTQYVRQVESLVRNSPFEPENRATLLNTSLSATSGVGRIFKDATGLGGVNIHDDYTFIIWARWKGNTADLFYIDLDASGTGGSIDLMITNSEIEVIHAQPAHLGGLTSFSVPINYTDIRPDSRHMFVVRYDSTSGIATIIVDNILIGSGAIANIHPSFLINGIYIGDTETVPVRSLRHYVQHISLFVGLRLSDIEVQNLWESGRERPGRVTSNVDFSEPAYANGVSIFGTGLWDKIWFFTQASTAIVRDSAEATQGGRILEVKSNANIAQIIWNEAFREPTQRFISRCRVTAGFNEEIGFSLLGGWDYISNTTWGGPAGSAIEFGVTADLLRVRSRINNITADLVTSPLVRDLGDWIIIRGEVDSILGEIRAKAWLDGEVEPVGWMIDIVIPTAFIWGDGFFVVNCVVANTTAEIDYINLIYNSGPPPPQDPTLIGSVDVDNITTLTGSAYVGGNPFLESRLTIVRFFDQSVVDEITSPVTDWVFQDGELPYNTIMQASIVYIDSNNQETNSSNIVNFIVPDPNPEPVTPCEVVVPVFRNSESNQIQVDQPGGCGSIPTEYEDCS